MEYQWKAYTYDLEEDSVPKYAFFKTLPDAEIFEDGAKQIGLTCVITYIGSEERILVD